MKVWILTNDYADTDILGVSADLDTLKRKVEADNPDYIIEWSGSDTTYWYACGNYDTTGNVSHGGPNCTLQAYEVIVPEANAKVGA